MQTLGPGIEVVGAQAQPQDRDLQIALLSMPFAFGTNRGHDPGRGFPIFAPSLRELRSGAQKSETAVSRSGFAGRARKAA
jgi:hypothetical protein